MTIKTDAAINVVNDSNLLRNLFMSKCNQVISSRETSLIDFYYGIIGYFTINTVKNWDVDIVV